MRRIGDQEIAVWENTGGSWFRRTAWLNLIGASAVATGDIDRDGDPDLAIMDGIGGVVGWLENVDGSVGTMVEHPIRWNSGASSVSVADIDGDGWLDLTGTDTSGTVFYLVNQLDATNGSLWDYEVIEPFATGG